MSNNEDTLDVRQLIDCVPYVDGELSNIDRRLVDMLIKEEMERNKSVAQKEEQNGQKDTLVFKDEILQNTYMEFLNNGYKLPPIQEQWSLPSQIQNDKNQKINLSLLQSNAKAHWTAYLNQLDQILSALQHEKKQMDSQMQQLQAKRKREQTEFGQREQMLNNEWWSLVRGCVRVNKGVNDLEVVCRKYRRILGEREEKKQYQQQQQQQQENQEIQ
jgi:hypothetical protein